MKNVRIPLATPRLIDHLGAARGAPAPLPPPPMVPIAGEDDNSEVDTDEDDEEEVAIDEEVDGSVPVPWASFRRATLSPAAAASPMPIER